MTRHTHAKAGGGTQTHDHEFSANDAHGHEGLLPLPRKAGAKAKESAAAMAEVDRLLFASLSSDQRNALDKSDFAYVDEDGQGHYPIKDEARVRSAISYFPKGIPQDKRAAAARKIRAAAKKLGIDIGDDSDVMKFGEAAALTIVPSEPVQLTESLLPYLKTENYNFDEYGEVNIAPRELLSVKQHFDEHVRGDELPVVDVDHLDPVYQRAAVGWVKELVPDDPQSPTELRARVEWNPKGEEIVATDQYRYTSPNLLRNWTDPISGVTYPLIAAGVDMHTREKYGDTAALALTNFPKMRNLGRIAASEDGTQCVITAVGSVPRADSPSEAYRLAMAEDGDLTGNDGDTLPPCRWSPVFTVDNPCQGFTRALDDGDGDEPGDLNGCCLLAGRGCNGYAPISSNLPGVTSPLGMSEPRNGDKRMGQPETGATGTPPADAQKAADRAEQERIAAAEQRTMDERIKAAEERARAAEERAKAAEESIRASERGIAIGKAGDRLNALLHSKRITPAEHEKLSAAENLPRLAMAENGFVLDALEARPEGAAFAELGTVRGSSQEGGAPDEVALTKRAQQIWKEATDGGRKLSMAEAGKQAARELAPKGGR